MIDLKKENNHLIKESHFLQTILRYNQVNNPLALYINSLFISDVHTFQNQVKECIPDDRLETIYYINGNKGKKRRKNNKNTKI